MHLSNRNKIWSHSQFEHVYQLGIGEWNIFYVNFDRENGQEKSHWSVLLGECWCGNRSEWQRGGRAILRRLFRKKLCTYNHLLGWELSFCYPKAENRARHLSK
jgi:hypothetical protein